MNKIHHRISLAFIIALSYFSVNAQLLPLDLAKSDSILSGVKNLEIHEEDISLFTVNEMLSTYMEHNQQCNVLKTKVLKSKILDPKNDYKQIIELCNQVFKEYTNACDSMILINNYFSIAFAHLEIKNPTIAIELGLKGIEFCKNNPKAFNTKSRLYNIIGTGFLENNELDSACYYFKLGLEIALASNFDLNIQSAYYNLSVVKYNMEEMDSATFYLKKSLAYAKKTNFELLIGKNYSALGVYSQQMEEKLLYFDSAIVSANKIKAYPDLVNYYFNRSILYEGLNLYEKSLNDLWSVTYYKDSLFDENLAKASAEMKEKYDSEKRSLEISNLKLQKQDTELKYKLVKSNQIRLAIIGATLIILLIFLSLRHVELRKIKNLLSIKNADLEVEKERSEHLLLNILPKEVADELKVHGEVKARHFEHVTILLCDIKEFTQITQSISPEELVEEINVCFKAFDQIVSKYKIDKIKTIGDAYMAAGGMHKPAVSETKDVINAAIDMQAFMQGRKKHRITKGKVPFEMRIGIHTGPVVAGIVGFMKFQYDIWGDTVNTAARMEATCQENKINISESTYNLISRNRTFKFEERGSIEVKGKGKLKMWYVERA